jgi:hypothetical protein
MSLSLSKIPVAILAGTASPAWHADALRETAERRARDEETVLEWKKAKAKLRSPLAPCQSPFVG